MQWMNALLRAVEVFVRRLNVEFYDEIIVVYMGILRSLLRGSVERRSKTGCCELIAESRVALMVVFNSRTAVPVHQNKLFLKRQRLFMSIL